MEPVVDLPGAERQRAGACLEVACGVVKPRADLNREVTVLGADHAIVVA